MAVKVTIVSPSKNRISINKQDRKEIRTVAVTGSVQNIVDNLPNKLQNLKDVDASGASSNDTLVYDEVSEKYIVKELPIVNGGTF